MKTASIADLRNQFRRVSAWLDNGETVEIMKRGKPYARLQPLAAGAQNQTPKIDFASQRQAIWRGRKFSAEEVVAMRRAEWEGEEG